MADPSRMFLLTSHVIKELTLLKPGSILPESTTTTGDSLPVTHINPFHIISADVTIIPGAIYKQTIDMHASSLFKGKTKLDKLLFQTKEHKNQDINNKSLATCIKQSSDEQDVIKDHNIRI